MLFDEIISKDPIVVKGSYALFLLDVALTDLWLLVSFVIDSALED